MPSPGPMFAAALRSVKGLSTTLIPLDAEFVAATIVGVFDVDLVDVDNPRTFLGERFVDYLGKSRSPEALPLLLGLAAVMPEPVSHQARFAVRRLAAAGRPEPDWGEAISRVHFVDAWIATEEFEDQDLVCATFQHQGYPPHAIVVLTDHNYHGLVRQASLSTEPAKVRADWESISDMTIRALEAQELANRLATGLAWFRRYLDPPCEPEVRSLAPLLEARLRVLPEGREIVVPEVSLAKRRSLVAAFRKSPEGRALGKGRAFPADFVRYFIDFACDYGAGDPLRWSPIAIELCLVDWFPRKIALLSGGTGEVPDVLRAWVRHAIREKGWSDGALRECLEAIDQFEPEYLEAMEDPSRYGPAKEMVLGMVADDVDLGDAAAVQAWVDASNARSAAEYEKRSKRP